MTSLAFQGRLPAEGSGAGLLVLHHGRGSDEHDLLGLADVYDPERRLHVVTPRGPLAISGFPGAHWYVVPRVGHPDPATFQAAFGALAAFHDELWERTGIGPDRTILGGFSMGAVMSYALGLAGDRPVPAGIIAHSGFVPTVEGWQPDLGSRQELPVLVTHGTADPIIGLQFAHRAVELLEAGSLPSEYVETGAVHQIDAEHARAAQRFVQSRLAAFT